MHERGDDGGIHAPGKATDHAALADGSANVLHGLLNDRARRPIPGTSTDAEHEIAQDGCTILRVSHFGVELEPVQPALRILNGGIARIV